ncbi:MAG: hypothetical protein ACWA5L_07995 [bacterium]
MMKNIFNVALLLLLVTGCVSVEGVGPGPFEYNKSVKVNLGQTWTAWPRDGTGDMQSLSIDGKALDELLFADEIKDGDSLVYIREREKIVPKFSKDMEVTEIVEFIADSLSYISYQNVEISNIRPEKFGKLDGIRFDLTADTINGLNMQGTVKTVVKNEELTLILFLAPSEYYYPLHKDEVEQILASVSFL